VSNSLVSIQLSEWQECIPDEVPALKGCFLDEPTGGHAVAKFLNDSGKLSLVELRSGLQVSAYSHVGRIRVGNLDITVLPKLGAQALLRLLRYAYGFRQLDFLADSIHATDRLGLEDLLVLQLIAEAQDLISRGLQRHYIGQSKRLSSPQGRIDVNRIALDGPAATATLPCHFFPRIENTILNRVLMAGLQLAGRVTSALSLRRETRRLVSQMEEQVATVPLNFAVWQQATRKMNRLTNAYEPSLVIIKLLVEAQGITLEGSHTSSRLPGFLFDMNVFFQRLLSRFLRENLPGLTVCDEHGLRGMIRYSADYNPKKRGSPTPRPDYAIMQGRRLLALLDAKYRDLWEKPLPRDMLYQLAIYAFSHREKLQSSILYPTMSFQASEQRLDITDPIYGKHLGQVCLRPLNLDRLAELLSFKTASAVRERVQIAKLLAFGSDIDG